jgi:rare lipoprotein A
MRAVRVKLSGPLTLALAALALAGCAGNPTQSPGSQPVANAARSARGNPPFYEVFGERYYVLDSSAGFAERGVASWYGRDFHGKPTSSGEIYDMREMTAAHKTLPLPTWVEVTNLVNGRSVIVRVNDRGPFVDDRIIDLSQRAAEELDMIRDGTTRVQVRALGAPVRESPLLAATPSAPAATSARGISIISAAQADAVGPGAQPFRPLYVQVGAFADGSNATELVERLRDEGFRDSFVLSTGEGRDRLHRVRIGPIQNESQFDRIRADLRTIDIVDARLVQDN